MNNICAQLKKKQGNLEIDVQLSLEAGKVTAFVGPSGSGKTTVLRMLAGLEKPDVGYIQAGDKNWLDTANKHCAPVQQRRVGFVFQDYALFDHLTVEQNVAYGVEKTQRNTVVKPWLETLQLTEFADKQTSQLSGGQRQRVAIGRAMAIAPALLLLDEPFSALDYSLRRRMRNELKGFIAQADCPVVLVTHDLEEARELADVAYVFDQGQLVRAGNMETVISIPRNKVAAQILGWQNFLPITGFQDNSVYGTWGVYNLDHRLPADATHLAFQAQYIRFHSHESFNGIGAVVTEVNNCGAYREVHLEVGGELRVVAHRFWDEPIPAPGNSVSLYISSMHMHALSDTGPHIDDLSEECKTRLLRKQG